MTRRLSLLLAASALCLLFLVPTPASQAKPERIKLTGTVTGLAPAPESPASEASVVTLKQGSKKVGKLIAFFEGSAGTLAIYVGTIKLTVGSVRGKHEVRFFFRTTRNYCPACSPPSYGTEPKFGNASLGSEAIIVHGSSIPSTIGSKFGVTLVPK